MSIFSIKEGRHLQLAAIKFFWCKPGEFFKVFDKMGLVVVGAFISERCKAGEIPVQ